jgi:Flp pilus assembly protein TadG
MSSSGRASRGQATVELALALSVLVLVLVGLLDIGRAVFTQNAVSQAAREAARRAAVEVTWVDRTPAQCSAPNCPARAAFMAELGEIVEGAGLSRADGQVHLHCGAPGDSLPRSPSGWNGCPTSRAAFGNLVTVGVTYQFRPLLPFVDRALDAMWAQSTELIG